MNVRLAVLAGYSNPILFGGVLCKVSKRNGLLYHLEGGSVTLRKSDIEEVETRDEALLNSILVFPNPTTGELNLKGNFLKKLNEENCVYSIFSLDGRLVDSKKLTKSTVNVKSPGIYVLIITSNDSIIHRQKIVVVQ